MRNAMGRSSVTSVLTASLLAALFVGAVPAGCGGKSGGPPAQSASAPSDVASLAVFVVKESGSGDAVNANAAEAVTQALGKGGYRLVDSEKAADVFARLSVSKQQEESLIKMNINGKERITYKVSVALDLVDRDGKPVEKVTAEYSTSDDAADEGEITAMINKLSESAKLATYAKASKVERAERQKREADEQKAAADEKQAREEGEAKAQADRETKKRLEGTYRDAEKLRVEIDELIRKNEAAIPAEKLDALKKRAEELKSGGDPGTGRHFAHQHTSYTLENAWWQPEGETAAVMGRTLSSDVVTNGATDGKKLSVAFNAKAGHCYTVLMRFKTTTGQEEINNLGWTAKGGNTLLQRYSMPWAKGMQRIAGACATKDTAVTLAAELVFAGTKNGLRYVVVGTPKAKFPLYLATYLNLESEDPCDYDAWYSLWSDPVPGTVVYSGKEPFLIDRPDEAGQSWVSLYNATRGDIRAQKKDLESTPPAAIKFATQQSFRGCSKERAEGADSVKLAKCHTQIDAKYQGQWDAAEKAKENSLTYTGRRAAELSMKRINEADANDREKLCKPIEQQIAKKWEATFNKIVDLYTETPHKSALDRAGELKTQDRN